MKNTYAERNPQLLLFSHSVFISRVPDVCLCFFVCFSGLQRETDSSTNAGLEMDAISERNIRPLLGYDWIAGGLFNNAKKINLSAMEDFPVLICINGIHHSFHPSRCFFLETWSLPFLFRLTGCWKLSWRSFGAVLQRSPLLPSGQSRWVHPQIVIRVGLGLSFVTQ